LIRSLPGFMVLGSRLGIRKSILKVDLWFFVGFSGCMGFF